MNRLGYHDVIGRNRRGEVASPDGLGNPTPTDSTARFQSHMSPLWGLMIFVHRARL